MNREEVKRIFDSSKIFYLYGFLESNNPTAFLLGGQGAVGKGQLAKRIVEQNPMLKKIFFINGDIYRREHPDNKFLQDNPETYSEKTQIFSSVFTEEFISESIKRKINVSVEGTMRNPNTPLSTAALFKEAGYRVEAYVIAAPIEFSSLNLYTRYARELLNGEKGRLADKISHDKAAEMMPQTLDLLFDSKAVDAIHIYSCFAKEKIAEYILSNGVWSNKTLPSKIIRQSREEQKNNTSVIRNLLNRSSIIESVIDNPNILSDVKEARDKLENLLKNR